MHRHGHGHSYGTLCKYTDLACGQLLWLYPELCPGKYAHSCLMLTTYQQILLLDTPLLLPGLRLRAHRGRAGPPLRVLLRQERRIVKMWTVQAGVLLRRGMSEGRLAPAQAGMLLHGCFGGELESFGDCAAHSKNSGQTENPPREDTFREIVGCEGV